jgi:membrane protease YdiL (CAAX protease family)
LVSKLLVHVASYLLLVMLGGAVVYPWWKRVRTHLLPLPRLRWGRWTAGEIILVYFIFLFMSLLVLDLLKRSGFFLLIYGKEPDPLVQSLWVNPFALPLCLAASFYGLYSLSLTYPNDLGISPSRWRANVSLGYAAFVVAAPVVLGTFAILNLLPNVKPHEFTRFGGADTTLLEWGLFLFAVAVFAPIMEELIFRGLLQGWLRRATLTGHLILIAVVCTWSLSQAMPKEKTDKTPQIRNAQKAADQPQKRGEAESSDNGAWKNLADMNWGRVVVTTLLAGGYLLMLHRQKSKNLFMTEADFLPRAAPVPEDADASEDTSVVEEVEAPPLKLTPAEIEAKKHWEEVDRQQQRQRAWLAMYGSAMTFALAHPAWPDPIALVLLGLVLGWLAQRTQNLLPGLVVHGLFNSVAWLTLFLAHFLPDQDTNGNDVTNAWRPSRAGSIVSTIPGSWLPRFR